MARLGDRERNRCLIRFKTINVDWGTNKDICLSSSLTIFISLFWYEFVLGH